MTKVKIQNMIGKYWVRLVTGRIVQHLILPRSEGTDWGSRDEIHKWFLFTTTVLEQQSVNLLTHMEMEL